MATGYTTAGAGISLTFMYRQSSGASGERAVRECRGLAHSGALTGKTTNWKHMAC